MGLDAAELDHCNLVVVGSGRDYDIIFLAAAASRCERESLDQAVSQSLPARRFERGPDGPDGHLVKRVLVLWEVCDVFLEISDPEDSQPLLLFLERLEDSSDEALRSPASLNSEGCGSTLDL